MYELNSALEKPHNGAERSAVMAMIHQAKWSAFGQCRAVGERRPRFCCVSRTVSTTWPMLAFFLMIQHVESALERVEPV